MKQSGQGEEGEEGVEPSWRLSWSIGGLLGAMGLIWGSWGPLGALLGRLGVILGLSWGSLGDPLGAPEGLLGQSWRPSIKRGVPYVRPPSGPLKIASWGALGAILGALGASWAPLGAPLGHVGAILRPQKHRKRKGEKATLIDFRWVLHVCGFLRGS